MRAFYEQVTNAAGESFVCRRFRCRRFVMPWHFHPQCELTLIVRGEGTRYVGDNISRFSEGDLVFLGPNLPHYWWSDVDCRRAEAVVIQFEPDWMGLVSQKPPEAEGIRRLLTAAARGILPAVQARDSLVRRLLELPGLTGWPRLCGLLEILGILAGTPGARPIASAAWLPILDENDGRRLGAVCRYVNESCHGAISHAQAARLASFSPAGFSRFFHKRMGKTFENYVTEVRIGHACRRLLESDESIAEIAFATGFNNLSNFNRHFRRLKGLAPREYRRSVKIPWLNPPDRQASSAAISRAK